MIEELDRLTNVRTIFEVEAIKDYKNLAENGNCYPYHGFYFNEKDRTELISLKVKEGNKYNMILVDKEKRFFNVIPENEITENFKLISVVHQYE